MAQGSKDQKVVAIFSLDNSFILQRGFFPHCQIKSKELTMPFFRKNLKIKI